MHEIICIQCLHICNYLIKLVRIVSYLLNNVIQLIMYCSVIVERCLHMYVCMHVRIAYVKIMAITCVHPRLLK